MKQRKRLSCQAPNEHSRVKFPSSTRKQEASRGIGAQGTFSVGLDLCSRNVWAFAPGIDITIALPPGRSDQKPLQVAAALWKRLSSRNKLKPGTDPPTANSTPPEHARLSKSITYW